MDLPHLRHKRNSSLEYSRSVSRYDLRDFPLVCKLFPSCAQFLVGVKEKAEVNLKQSDLSEADFADSWYDGPLDQCYRYVPSLSTHETSLSIAGLCLH